MFKEIVSYMFALVLGVLVGYLCAHSLSDTTELRRQLDASRLESIEYRNSVEASAARLTELQREADNLHRTLGEVSAAINISAGGIGQAVTDVGSARQEIQRITKVLREVAKAIQVQELSNNR